MTTRAEPADGSRELPRGAFGARVRPHVSADGEGVAPVAAELARQGIGLALLEPVHQHPGPSRASTRAMPAPVPR